MNKHTLANSVDLLHPYSGLNSNTQYITRIKKVLNFSIDINLEVQSN